jgi:hypothetical protein
LAVNLALWRGVTLPLAIVAVGLGALIGGRPGQVLLLLGVVLAAVLCVLAFD